jgi:nicotinamide-nucleotide amidase
MAITAEIITIGEEILSGQTLDSNSAFIGRKLADAGIEVRYKVSVGDKHEDIVEAITIARERSAVTICTGGLGPTRDDITKNAICAAFDCKLSLRDDILDRIKKRYEERQQKMPAFVQSMALQPLGSELIPNSVGTAPGIVFQEKDRYFASVPGVPSEMQAMVVDHIVPYLMRREDRRHIVLRKIRTIGIFESHIAEVLEAIEPDGKDLRLAYLPSYKGVDLRVTSLADSHEAAVKAAEELTQKIVNRLSEHVYTIGDESMAELVAGMLKKRGETLATAESCTGGLIAKTITDMPGSSDYFLGGAVPYSNEAKMNLLKVDEQLLVDHGAVSAEVAEALATNAREVFGADYAISTTGIAGPSGGTNEKPVGLVFIGYADSAGSTSRRLDLHGTRERIRERSVLVALDLLRVKLAAK